MHKDYFDSDCPLCNALEEEFGEGEYGFVDWDLEEDEIDEASNRVLDLILLGRLDEAEVEARELMINYPDLVDGLDRLARVFKAKGDYMRAIQYFESAIAFTRVHDGFDQDSRDSYREEINEIKKKLP